MEALDKSLAIIFKDINKKHIRAPSFNYLRGDRYQLLAKIEALTHEVVRSIALQVPPSEIYYENVSQFDSQEEVDRALQDLCHILAVPIWQLRVCGTAKGLVFGPVQFHLDDEIVNANAASGVVIPQDVIEITRITTTARWILIVEKDAAFEKIIQDNDLYRLGPGIIITGKGFPDVGTRMLVRRLWETLGLPIFVLTDADPFGIDIMCVYRFGSLAMSAHSQDLACPAIRWLGVHPTDIRRLGVDGEPLTLEDKSRLKSLEKRPGIISNSQLLKEVQCLIDGGVKAEMEALSKFGASYLVGNYIMQKMICREVF